MGHGAILIAAQGLLASGARAGDWQTDLSIGVSEQFTDNVGLVSGDADKDSELTTSITPGIAIRGSGGRVQLNLDYDLTQTLPKIDSDRRDTRHHLTGSGNVEVWDRVVFIDTQASISRQAQDTGAVTTESETGQDQNRVEVRTLNLSPYFLHHFGQWVDTETRLFFSGVNSDSANSSDTFTNRQTVTLDSGRRFQTMKWSATVNKEKTSRNDSTPSNDSLASRLDLTYVLHPEFSIVGGGGYEELNDGTLSRDRSGMTWEIGFDARPTSKSSLRLTYGDRLEERSWTFEGEHRLSERTTISASYNETFRTSQQQVGDDLSFISTDDNGNLIDTRTNLPFQAGSDTFGFSNDTFRQKRFSSQISGSRGRNSFSGQVYWESRQADTTGNEEVVLGGSANFDREMSRRLNGSLGLTYRGTDFGTTDGREQTRVSVTAGLSYEIFREVRGTLNYILTKVDDDLRSESLTENAVTVGLQKSF